MVTVVVTMCAGSAFAFFNIKELEDRAIREIKEYDDKLSKQAISEINNYKNDLVSQIGREIQEYEKTLVNRSQEEINKIQRTLEIERETKINNQIKESQERIRRAEESAKDDVEKEYSKTN